MTHMKEVFPGLGPGGDKNGRRKYFLGLLGIMVTAAALVALYPLIKLYWSEHESNSKPKYATRSFLVKGHPGRPGKAEYADDQIIIQFKSSAKLADRQRVFRLLESIQTLAIKPRSIAVKAASKGAESIGSNDVVLVKFKPRSVSAKADGPRVVEASLSTPNSLAEVKRPAEEFKSVEGILAEVRHDPSVFFAQPNYRYHITAQYPANDALYVKGASWGVASAGTSTPIGPLSNLYGSEAEKVWLANQTGSSKVFVGIIDSGAQMDHPDLKGNIDARDAMDFYRTSGDTNYNKDENGHGTHVAGIIGAVGNNGRGIAGVAWQVSMIPVKFIGPDGTGDSSDAVQAFNYLIRLRQKGLNIVAINASWATPENDTLLLAAIKNAARAGIVTVSAASNEGVDIGKQPMYPANFDTSLDNSDQSGTLAFNGNITVAAIDSTGQVPAFSNFGGTVELGAPGVNIVSTMIPNPSPILIPDPSALISDSDGSTYAALDGTSMAAPFVTGAIVLLASNHLDSSGNTILKAQDICSLIRNNALATATPSLNGKATTGGRLDLAKLLQ